MLYATVGSNGHDIAGQRQTRFTAGMSLLVAQVSPMNISTYRIEIGAMQGPAQSGGRSNRPGSRNLQGYDTTTTAKRAAMRGERNMSYNVTPESASVDYLRPKMSEMIERVARAIYKLRNDDAPFLSDVAAGPEHAFAFEAARAAITAMCEPTEGMVKSAPFPIMYNSRYEGVDPPPEIAWQRMIDAALSESPEMKSPSQNSTHIQKGNEQDQDNNNLDHGG